LQPGGSLGSEQKQKPLREGVISDAHKLHRNAGGKKFELTIGFETDRPITPARRRSSQGTSAFAATIGSKQEAADDPEQFEAMPEIASIYLTTRITTRQLARMPSLLVDLMSPRNWRRSSGEKEVKASEYCPAMTIGF